VWPARSQGGGRSATAREGRAPGGKPERSRSLMPTAASCLAMSSGAAVTGKPRRRRDVWPSDSRVRPRQGVREAGSSSTGLKAPVDVALASTICPKDADLGRLVALCRGEVRASSQSVPDPPTLKPASCLPPARGHRRCLLAQGDRVRSAALPHCPCSAAPSAPIAGPWHSHRHEPRPRPGVRRIWLMMSLRTV